MNSTLHDEKTFYQTFLKDLKNAKDEIIIESPFITTARVKMFNPIFKKLINKGVKIYVVTRHPHEHTGIVHVMIGQVVGLRLSGNQLVALIEVDAHHQGVRLG